MKQQDHNKTVNLIKEFKNKKLIGERKQRVNKITKYDQDREEQKFLDFFRNLNVVVDFIDLEVYDDLIFWGGTVDGNVQFIYKVTHNEKSSGVEFNYLDDFNPQNPGNNQLIEMIEAYYDIFYKYWRDNLIQQ